MNATVPTRIVLKSNTRVSLNDRFSSITVQNIRSNIAAEHQVSAANRRLLQQLANRSILEDSTLNTYHQQQPAGGGLQINVNVPVMKKSLQERLGKPNIKSRLSMPGGQPIRDSGSGQGNGGIITVHGEGDDQQWMVNRVTVHDEIDDNQWMINRVTVHDESDDNQWMANTVQNRGGLSTRGFDARGVIQGRGRGIYNRFTTLNTVNTRGGNTRGVSRGMRGGGRGGLSRGGNSNITLKDLDTQLDAYMARTKSHLDAELDAYMSEVTN